MGRRGPAPKPTRLRLLHGDKANRINDNEPQPREALPECPSNVSPDVKAIWDYTLAELVVMGLASAADRDALICYCEAVVTHRRASELLAKSSVLIKGLHGGLVRNPAVQIQRDSAMAMRCFAQEFGLTPSARSQINMGRVGDDASGAARYLTG